MESYPQPSVLNPVTQNLVSPSGTMPLESAALRVTAKGGIARVVLEQTFANHHPDPLAVTYVLPLPADAAVSGFSFRVGDRRIEGEIDRKRAARERYDDAIAHGHTAALLEQERSSLFTQEIGNVPPGARVVCEIVIDQPLRWLDEGSWEWRFPLAAAPRYLGAPGRTPDAQKIAFDVTQTFRPRASLAMEIADALVSGRSPESPSHPLQCAAGVGCFRVELGSGNQVELDRDVVVRWPVAQMEPQVSAFVEGTHVLLTLVPPKTEAKYVGSVSRDLVILLDTSGSMGGEPLDQARRVSMALVDGLSDTDTIELIEFSNAPRRFRSSAIPATKENKQAANAWLAALRASGATEMRAGILEALSSIRSDAQRQVVLITDGLIGFEQEIVQEIALRLPLGSRVHTVGVGSSVNRSLTGPAARAGKGIECVIGLGEDPERAAARLRARTEAPLVVNVTLGGAGFVASAPEKIPDLYAGAPLLISARIRPEGGEITVRGRTAGGLWEERVRVSPNDVKKGALSALFGREAVEDCEMKLAAGLEPKETIDAKVEELGLTYSIATRMTSWIAVDKTPSVDPRLPTRREIVPQMLPHGMSVDGLGLRPAMAPSAAPMRSLSMPMGGALRGRAAPPPMAAPPPASPMKKMKKDEIAYERESSREEAARVSRPAPAAARPGAPPPPAAEPESDEADDDVRTTAHPRPIAKGAFTGAVRVMSPARIVSRKGREIVIDITIEMSLAWDPSSFQYLVIVGGMQITGRVDLARSTRQGPLVPGHVARLVLLLDAETEAQVREVVFAQYAFAIV